MEELSPLEAFLREREVRQPGGSLRMALYLWDRQREINSDATVRPSFDDDPAGHFWSYASIQELVRSNQKIAVVKEIRSINYLGLKEAKELMDQIFEKYRKGELR
jgi:hypothetical protein